jgi:hypothetical protein
MKEVQEMDTERLFTSHTTEAISKENIYLDWGVSDDFYSDGTVLSGSFSKLINSTRKANLFFRLCVSLTE